MNPWFADGLDMLRIFGDKEMAQLLSKQGVVIDDALLRATLEDTDRSGWTVEQQQAANQAVTLLNETLLAAQNPVNAELGVLIDVQDAATVHTLIKITADIARYYLYDDVAPERVRERYNEAINWLHNHSPGRMTRLGLVIEARTDPPSGVVVGAVGRA